MNVYGVFDTSVDCTNDNTCLTRRKYHCFLLRKSYNNMQDDSSAMSSCVVDYSYPGAGYAGPPGKGSWSQSWTASVLNGEVLSVQEKACATTAPEDFLCKNGATCTEGSPFVNPDATKDYKQLPLPVGSNELTGDTYKAHTVAACYCADYSNCNAVDDYLQQVGILHYYVTKVCQHGYDANKCEMDYTGATPQHRFAVRVECPTDACKPTTRNRLKIIAQKLSNDFPKWARNADGTMASGCGAVGFDAHGKNRAGKLVLPPDAPNLDMVEVSGGVFQDKKIWNFRRQFRH
jgi:hypothetical protein